MNGYVERGAVKCNPSCVTYLSNMADYAVRLIFYCALKHISGL